MRIKHLGKLFIYTHNPEDSSVKGISSKSMRDQVWPDLSLNLRAVVAQQLKLAQPRLAGMELMDGNQY